MRIWDLATGQQDAALVGHSNRVMTAAVAPDGTWLASGDDGSARIWDPVSCPAEDCEERGR